MRLKSRSTVIAAFVGVLLFASVAGGLYAYFEYTRPTRNISTADADLEIGATELFAQFESNEQRANTEYLNKIISVTGVVGEVSTNQNNEKVVVLRSPDMIFGVFCTMLPDETGAASNLAEGQTVTIKGLCTGYTTDVVLTECSLVK
ncbi:MAG TPA: hypothetical protein VEY71_05015 [Chitinophagales bacterium]|nr:hypothetical protein [Chitinophagales bacterium]